jgi:hypothetical protein
MMTLPLGHVVITAALNEQLSELDLVFVPALLSQHAHGEWGDLCEEDWAANDRAVVEGGRILSAYQLPSGNRIWVITEADRSSTCLLRPDEY